MNPVLDVVEAWDAYTADRTNEQAAVLFVLAMNALRESLAAPPAPFADSEPIYQVRKKGREHWKDVSELSLAAYENDEDYDYEFRVVAIYRERLTATSKAANDALEAILKCCITGGGVIHAQKLARTALAKD